MPIAGKPSAIVDHRVIGLQLVVPDRLDFLVHQRLDLMRAGVADDDEAAVVADEGRQLVVLQDGREFLEDRATVVGSSICASTSLRGLLLSSRISE